MKTRLAKFMGSRDTKSRHENVTDSLAKALIANSPLGIYVIQNGQFKVISPRFMEITGYSEGELEKIEPLSLVYEEDRDYVRTAAVQMLKMERSSPYQFRIVTKQGDIRWIMETVASITYQGLRSALGNFMDITDQVLLYHRVRYREPQTSPHLSGAKKWIKNLLEVFLFNTLSIVLNRNLHIV